MDLVFCHHSWQELATVCFVQLPTLLSQVNAEFNGYTAVW
jgi:hypothetical protein